MSPPNSFYRLSSLGFCHIYFPKIKPTSLMLYFQECCVLQARKKKMMQAQRSLPSDCSCHKAQCNHTEETRRRTHVIMINPRLGKTCGRKLMLAHRRLSRQWSRMSAAPVWCQLSGDSSALRPTNQPTHTGQAVLSSLTEQRFTILSDKTRCFQSPYMRSPVGGIKCWLLYSWKTWRRSDLCVWLISLLKHVSCQVHITSTQTDFHIRRVRGMLVAWLS